MHNARLAATRNVAIIALAILLGSLLQPTEWIADRLRGAEVGAAQATTTPAATPTAMSSPSPLASSSVCDATFPDAPTQSIDQAAAIKLFLDDHANETVCFAADATYRVEATITLRGWSGRILGQGAAWQRTDDDEAGAQLRILDGSDILIDGLTIEGAATLEDIQTRRFDDDQRQGQHAIALESAADITIRNATLINTWGDGVYIRGRDNEPDDGPSRNVLLDGLVLSVNGRNAISVISVDGLVVQAVRSSDVSLHGFDAEPNRSTDIVANVRIQGSDWRTFDAADADAGTGYAVVLTPGYADVQVRDIAIVGNTMDRAVMRIDGFSSDAPARNIVVTGNRSEEAGDATFLHIRGFEFSDNGSIGASLEDVE